MASFRLNILIRRPEQVESAATYNHSILALSNNRQFAAARLSWREDAPFNIPLLLDSLPGKG